MKNKKNLEKIIELENETVINVVHQWKNHSKTFIKELQLTELDEVNKDTLRLECISDIFVSIIITHFESWYNIPDIDDKREAMHILLDCMLNSIKCKYEKFLKDPSKFKAH